MISNEDLTKYRFNPKLKDKEIKELFANNNKSQLLNLFSIINTNEFYNYLINNNLIVFFDVKEIIPLLNNIPFINYLARTNIDIFNNLTEEDFTKELITYIDSNYYSFLNANFEFSKYPILFENKDLGNLIIENIDNIHTAVNIINKTDNQSTIKKIIDVIKQKKLELDIELLDQNAFKSPVIGRYLVFDLDINNISLLKAEAYKKCYEELLIKIKNGEISFENYDVNSFPDSLLTKAVYDRLVYNRKNERILKLFPEEFKSPENDFILSVTLSEEDKKSLFEKNKSNDEFFKLFIRTVDENNSHYLDIFEYNNLSRDSIKTMVDSYINGNRFVRTFLLKLESKTINNMDLIYEALVEKEQNNEIIINSLVGFINADLCNQKTIFNIFKLIAKGVVTINNLENSFWLSNDFLNICLVNNKYMYINRFKSKAFEPKNEFIDNEELVNTIKNIGTPELELYLKTYLNKFNLEHLYTRKHIRNYRLSITDIYSHKNFGIIEHLCLSGKRNPLSVKYINSENSLYAFKNFGDVLNEKTKNYLDSLSLAQLNKINSSHIRHIYHMLDNYIYEDEDKLILALNIYLTLGYNRAIDYLNSDSKKNYGNLTETSIKKMFYEVNVSDVSFAQYGHGYQPIINEELLNIIFGMNYKASSPIKLYLNKPVISNIITKEDKKKLHLVSGINKFFDYNFSYCINNWILIKEEYYKKQNASKLKNRLNIFEINDIIDNLTRVKNLLGPRDRYLSLSDVFKYAGKDNQYVSYNYKEVPKRVVELSRQMDGMKAKCFPNINFNYGEYSLNTYNPMDRKILSAGYKSDCCFRPLASADNNGAENSFIKYCCSTNYGGGIEILDKKGNMLAFCPILTNGNVLMIHSVESKLPDSKMTSLIFDILKEYGNRVISESNNSNTKIDFVCITNSTLFDETKVKEELREDKKFTIYDPKNSYYGMYNNLDKQQYVLCNREGLNQDNIDYSKKPSLYSYPKFSIPFTCISFTSDIYSLIRALETCNQIICEKSDRRFRKDKNSEESYELLQDIKYYKKEHLNIYERLLKMVSYDIYSDYITGIKLISEFARDVSIESFANIKDFYYSTDWYITVSIDNEIKCEYSPEGKEECMEIVKQLKNSLRESEDENVRSHKKI